jgi:hypothetical protein
MIPLEPDPDNAGEGNGGSVIYIINEQLRSHSQTGMTPFLFI